jgi:uncharacterized protein YcfJ
MNRLLVSILACFLAAATATASAQTYGGSYFQPSPDPYGQASGVQYDYARVIRVDPVFDSGYGSYSNAGYGSGYGQHCYERQTVVNGYDPYGNDYYRNDGYYDPYGGRQSGSAMGGTIATVIGGVVGAAIGSQIGGGSARYATSAIGTMVGGIAGRQIYEQGQRERNRTGTVRVCDPVPVNGRYDDRYGDDRYDDGRYIRTGDRGVTAYDVTYEYANRHYTTRTNYHPGDRIRVRVDVRPE